MPRLPAIGWLVIGLATGLALSLLLRSAQPRNSIVVGSTGTTLSAVLSFGGSTIVVGGGSYPHDGIELADRATVPWQRPYDLLVVPGWDTQHLPGTLGFVERRAVRAIAVIGVPDNDPTWTILERRTRAYGIGFTVVTEPSTVRISERMQLVLRPLDRASHACLQVGAVIIGIVDAHPAAKSVDPCGRSSALILLRQSSGGLTSPLVVRPQPRRASDLPRVAPYEVQLGRGQRVRLRVTEHEVRLEQKALVGQPSLTPSAP